jgi:predicted PurR-regulated permease PerM
MEDNAQTLCSLANNMDYLLNSDKVYQEIPYAIIDHDILTQRLMFTTISKLPRWLFIQLIIPLTILNGWLLYLAFRFFEPLMTIFIIATLLSFLLDYPIQLLQQWGIKRGYAISAMILLTVSILAIAGVTLLPQLIGQLSELANRLPMWLDSSGKQFEALDNWFEAQNIPIDLSEIADKFSDLLPEEIKILPNQLLEVVLGTTDRLVEVIITFVLTIYLLINGSDFWHGIMQWLPNQWGQNLQLIFREQFRNYFMGQATIAGLMGLILTIAFFLLKIPFWLVFGLGIGSMVLVPFGDYISIAIVSILVSFKSIYLGGEVLAIAIITDQIIDNVFAPRILSHLVGLNPVWVVISLLIGGKLAGILGVLIAVPIAGTIKNIGDMLRRLSEIKSKE